MITQQKASLYLEQLQQNHPQAFKRNFLFYGFIQTKGALDELKEFIPWLIALTTFIPLIYFLSHYIHLFFEQLSDFQAQASAIICLMLFFMLILPLVIYQIRHTSLRLYQNIKNLPFKLAILIILQAINLKFFESVFLQGVLFFLSLSYGFIACYKENLFKSNITLKDQYILNQFRKACFWSHLHICKLSLTLLLTRKTSVKYQQRLDQKSQFQTLNNQAHQFEDQFYQSIKYINLESYVDELMK
jgi:hypothetical protein